MYNLRFITRENQEKRLLVLRRLFDLSLGTPCIISVPIFSKETGIDQYDICEAARYLSEEGLLTIEDERGGSPELGPYLCITHKGIVEVEQSIMSPTKATQHFPATVIQYFNDSVGAVQTGAHSTAHAVQQIGSNLPKEFKLTGDLRRSLRTLTPEMQEEAMQLIEGLEDEFRLSQPRKARVKAFLKELNELIGKAPVRKILSKLAEQFGVLL